MLVTPGCDPGIYGPDKDGVDWAFGSFNETAANDFQEKNGIERDLSVIWEFSKKLRKGKLLKSFGVLFSEIPTKY